MEIFKEIHGYKGLYEISNFGNVKSLRKNKLMSSGWMNRNKEGNAYRFVDLYKKSTKEKKLIHRLVAEHFIENPLRKPYINHIDNNPENNHYSNLEWVTNGENVKHAYDNNLILKDEKFYSNKSKAGKTSCYEHVKKIISEQKLTITQEIYDEIRILYSRGDISISKLSEQMSIGRTIVQKCIEGKYKYFFPQTKIIK